MERSNWIAMAPVIELFLPKDKLPVIRALTDTYRSKKQKFDEMNKDFKQFPDRVNKNELDAKNGGWNGLSS